MEVMNSLPPSTGVDYLRPELANLMVIGVEEHVVFPSIGRRIQEAAGDSFAAGILADSDSVNYYLNNYTDERIVDTDDLRISEMDANGIYMQILSHPGSLNPTHVGVRNSTLGIQLASDINDALDEVVQRHPNRYRALASLPLHSPEDAEQELRRRVEQGFVGATVSGSVGGEGVYLDRPEFDGVLSAFEELDVPLYIHPGVPPESVFNTYYKLDSPENSALFGTVNWGWHNEAAVHILRLAFSGTLDRHPGLKIATGHLGEMLPMMMQRWDTRASTDQTGLVRNISQTVREQVWIAVSGVYSLAPTQLALATFGADRLLFANDYPFIDLGGARRYIQAAGDVIAPEDLRKICQTNAEKLFKINQEQS